MTTPEAIALDRAKFDETLAELGTVQPKIAPPGAEFAATVDAAAAVPLQPGQTASPAMELLQAASTEAAAVTAAAAELLATTVSELRGWGETVEVIDEEGAAEVEVAAGGGQP